MQNTFLFRILASLCSLFLTVPTVCSADEEYSDSWYPRTVTSDEGTAVIHAPQIDAWTDFETLSAWQAFSITRTGSDDTYHGSISYDAGTDTDLQEREVLLHDLVINELTIGGLGDDSEEIRLVSEAVTSRSRTVPLDLVLEYLPAGTKIESSEGLNNEPPLIFAATDPALLLSVDSEPVFIPVDDGDLNFVINTNWDVLRVGEEGDLYFCSEGSWLTAADFEEAWRWAQSLPEQFGTIPESPNWTNVHECLPDDLANLAVPDQDEPAVFYTTEAAELLLLDGPAEWQAIGDNGLSFATNTRQELFRADDRIYFLASGRWFKAPQLTGPWIMATKLPPSFQDIPPESGDDSHPKSYIRKSVPGTREAWEAALVATIPRKAQIAKGSEAELDLGVNYAGDPVFAPIESTEIELAVNTTFQVLRFDGVYYLCHNATWLTGGSAHGPWKFAESIPEEFAAIPPTSPAYNTTFVKIDGSDEEVVDYSYTSGYEGAYVSESTVVHGTGYPSSAVTFTVMYGYSAGWYGYPYYPYYPWPPTYGYGSWYDPGTGRYGETIVGYGPYGAAGSTAVFNPETGAYARGRAVWDNDEFAGRGYAYNPNTNTSIARNRYIDFDDKEGWSQNVARRGDEWRYSESEWEDGRMETDFESSYGTEGQVVRERQGDTIVSEGTITGENRSATFESVIDDGSVNGNIEGSEGGSGTYDRTLDDGEITGGSTFTKDGQTIETDVTRTAEGVQREFETSSGGQGKSARSGDSNAFVYESGSGDKYAGRDGNVYQKTDDGWSAVENPGAQSASRSERSFTGVEPLPAGGFGSSDRASGAYSGTYQGASGQARAGYSDTRSSLNRDYQSRQNGFNRYGQHQSRMGAQNPRAGRGRRR
jgi:hypothetical protein